MQRRHRVPCHMLLSSDQEDKGFDYFLALQRWTSEDTGWLLIVSAV